MEDRDVRVLRVCNRGAYPFAERPAPPLVRVDHQHPLAGVKIDLANVERRPYQFLYKEGDDMYCFMHTETYEQISIQEALINNPGLLKEGQMVEVLYDVKTDTPLTCELPPFVELEVTYTEPGVKGDTATNSAKRATVETGAEVFVPLFIETGELIRVDTRTNKYAERVK